MGNHDRHTKRLPLVLLLLAIPFQLLTAVDFPDPPPVVDPYSSARTEPLQEGFLPKAGGEFSYNYAALKHSRDELFYLRLDAWAVLYNSGRFSIGYRFDSILMAGPVGSDDTAASVARFWLNAVQYEYGLHTAYRLDNSWSLLGEYSRTSLHPLRASFGETAYDILKLGVSVPVLPLTPGTVHSTLRIGYHTLFPFWESVLPQYRVRFSITPRVSYTHRGRVPFYFEAEPNLLLLNDETIGYELFAESGLHLKGVGGSLRPYLWLQYNDEAELLDSGGSPSRQIGLGMRISTSP